MLTLQQAYIGDENGPAPQYWVLRERTKAVLVAWAIPHLKDGALYADEIVEAAISSAEEMGRVLGDYFQGEIAGRYTIDGNPLTF